VDIFLNNSNSSVVKWLPLTEKATMPPLNDEQVAPIEEPVIFDSSQLFNAVGNNPEVYRRLLQLFLDQAEQQLARIQSKLTEDPQVLIAEAHKLKGAFWNVGAVLQGDVCQRLETAAQSDDTERFPALIIELNKAYVQSVEQIKSELS
jgi:HPt (histidine-containing phosphotransfer) domain-containing protein